MRALRQCINVLYLFWIIMVPGMSWIFAQSSNTLSAEAELDLDDQEKLEIALLDYPEHYIPWLKKQLAHSHLEKGSSRWLRAHWFLSQAQQSTKDQPLDELASSAWQQGLAVEW